MALYEQLNFRKGSCLIQVGEEPGMKGKMRRQVVGGSCEKGCGW
jgi:hypothetical protein